VNEIKAELSNAFGDVLDEHGSVSKPQPVLSDRSGPWFGRLALGLADLVVLTLVFAVSTAGISLISAGEVGLSVGVWGVALAGSVAGLACNAMASLYQMAGRCEFERFRRRVLAALSMPLVALALCGPAGGPGVAGLLVLGCAALLWLPATLFSEAVVRRWLIARERWGVSAVLIGSSRSVGRLSDALRRHPELGLRPVGWVGEPDRSWPAQLPHLGALDDLPGLAGHADYALVALSAQGDALDPSQLPFRRVIMVPEFEGLPSLWLGSCRVGDVPGLAVSNRGHDRWNRVGKRALDLAVAIPAFVAALPLLVLLAALVRLLSPGPAFFIQRRIGHHGSQVPIFKLRTMYVDAEKRLQDLLARDPDARQEWDRYMKLSRDPRVLPWIGEFLRRSSLDEVPQLWNVLRGDISLVGPRPFPEYHVRRFDPQFQALRSSVKPGLTGLWQVSERSDADLVRQQEIDTFYIRNWSLWLDLYIVAGTLPAVLSSRGAR